MLWFLFVNACLGCVPLKAGVHFLSGQCPLLPTPRSQNRCVPRDSDWLPGVCQEARVSRSPLSSFNKLIFESVLIRMTEAVILLLVNQCATVSSGYFLSSM